MAGRTDAECVTCEALELLSPINLNAHDEQEGAIEDFRLSAFDASFVNYESLLECEHSAR